MNADEIRAVIKEMINNKEIEFKLDLDIFDGYGKIEFNVYVNGECSQYSSISLGIMR